MINLHKAITETKNKLQITKILRIGVIFLVIFLLFLGVFLIIRFSQNGSRIDIGNPLVNSKDEEQSNIPIEPITIDVTKLKINLVPYLFSPVQTKIDIKNYGWNENELIYATNDGIYKSLETKNLAGRGVSSINFNDKGFALYQNNNEWYIFEQASGRNIKISVQGKVAKLNGEGNVIASFENSDIYMLDVKENKSNKIDAGVTIENLIWAYEVNKVALVGTSINSKEVKIVNDEGKIEHTITIPEKATLLDIAPDARYIAIQEQEMVVIKAVGTDTRDTVFKFMKDDRLTGNFINDLEFVIIQTQTDSLGRISSKVWKTQDQGTIAYITNTFAITNGIDTSIGVKTNFSQNVLTFVEKNGPVWILSLNPGQYPFYTDSGVFLQALPQKAILPGD